ncbi:MAG: hypothetical protein B6243_00900 [Anaerolineaceae bacterium 4572_5.2]|nr:MAG: hypothetical protein B6243_00900 [Anaerolineaceae bacterium 4572_5.2]
MLKFSGGYIATAEGTKVLPTPNVKLTVLPAKSCKIDRFACQIRTVCVAFSRVRNAGQAHTGAIT